MVVIPSLPKISHVDLHKSLNRRGIRYLVVQSRLSRHLQEEGGTVDVEHSTVISEMNMRKFPVDPS